MATPNPVLRQQVINVYKGNDLNRPYITGNLEVES